MNKKIRAVVNGVTRCALICILLVGACSGSNEEKKQTSNPADVINQKVEQINQEQASLTVPAKNVPTPDDETLKQRAVTILEHFCKEAVEGRVSGRFIMPSAPERFYLSDGLAARLNQLKPQLAQGFDLSVEITGLPAEGKYGYVEASLAVLVNVEGIPLLRIELMYETQYDKFHETGFNSPR